MPCGSCGQRTSEKVRVAGAVFHFGTGRGFQLPRQRVAHPVLARHPGAVIAAARGLEPGTHGQQFLDGDRAPCWVAIPAQQLGEVRDDRFANVRDVLLLNRDADERRDHALRHGLDVGVLGRAAAVEVTLEHQSAAMTDEQAMKAGDVCGGLRDRLEAGLP